MWVKLRHKIFFKIFRPLILLFLRIKMNFWTKKYKLPKGPHLILYNHPTNYDPIFVGTAMNRPTYFVATEDLFNIPYLSKILNYLVAPIPIQKNMKDLMTIRIALKVIKEGGNIAVAPEGNRNYSGKLNHIDFAIVKFIKLLKVPVVLYAVKGGFGASPRFSKSLRKGKIRGEVTHIISKEEVNGLSKEEIYEIIIKNLEVDDSLLGNLYRGKNLAEYMESAFYICPVCFGFHSIESRGNHIHCNKCKMSAEYTPSLHFKSNDEGFKYKTVREYYRFQDNYILNYDFDNLIYDFDDVTVYRTNKNEKKTELLSGRLVFDKTKLSISSKTDLLEAAIEDIYVIAIVYHNTLIVNLENTKYHIVGDERFNALKYLHLFTIIRNKDKGEKNAFLGI